jgi:hypothetical protein
MEAITELQWAEGSAWETERAVNDFPEWCNEPLSGQRVFSWRDGFFTPSINLLS